MISLNTAQQALDNKIEGLAEEIATTVVENRMTHHHNGTSVAPAKEISFSELDDEIMKIEMALEDAIKKEWIIAGQKEVALKFINLLDEEYDEIEDTLKALVDKAIVRETENQLELLSDGGR